MANSSKVQDLMSRDPVVLHPENTLHQAWTLFTEHRISGAPVVNRSGVLIGVLSQTDILRQAFSGPFADFSGSTYSIAIPYQDNATTVTIPEHLATVFVEDVMHQGAFAVTASESLSSAASCMRNERVHRLIVVDSQDSRRVVGVLSSLDLLKIFDQQVA